MTKTIKVLLCVGLGVAVVEVLRKLLHGFDPERPPIRVRSGGSIAVTADGGVLNDLGTEWRHEHSGRKPRRLRVTLTGTGCTGQVFDTNHVDIHCRSSAGPIGHIRVQLQSSGGHAHTHVSPPRGAPRSQPSTRKGLVWPLDASVVIDHVKIQGQTCTVTDPANAEVIIEQKA